MSTAILYRGMAEAQGVVRPFDILVRMHPVHRRLVANLLGCKLERCVDPHAQAWRVINANLRGLQARTHTIPEQLTPFSRNNNWWEIVTRTARGLGVRFYPGMPEEEVERLVFERFAEGFAQTHVVGEADAVDSLTDDDPLLIEVMSSLRLSPAARRTVVSAIPLAHSRAGDNLREGCQKLGEWFGANTRWLWGVSISSGLGLLREKLTDIYTSWTSLYRGRFGKVSAAVAVIYFQDLVDRAVDEFDSR